jgi:hypothetical protein
MAATNHLGAMNLLLQPAKDSDLILVCRGREFPVYRCLVSAFPIFYAACSSGFQASTVTFHFMHLDEI